MTDHAQNTNRLVTSLQEQSYVLAFAGQGTNWLDTLRDCVEQGSGRTLQPILEEAKTLLSPVASDTAATRPFGFQPLEWANRKGNENEPGSALDPDFSAAAVSVPGILTAQLAVLDVLEAQGLNIEVPAIGHSQGALGVHAVQDLSRASEILAIAQLIGAAVTRQGRITGLVSNGEHRPMVSVSGVTYQQLQEAIEDAFPDATDSSPVIGLKNARDTFVLVGRPADIEKILLILRGQAEKEAREVTEKLHGGAPFNPVISPLPVQVGFHHPVLQPAVEQVVTWAQKAGLDTELARRAAMEVMVTPVDWPAQVEATQASWILDIGPDSGVVALTAKALAGKAAATFAVNKAEGQAKLFDAGQAPVLPQAFSEYAPKVVQDGESLKLSTKFTELTGKSPIMLAGMTPTTVDPEIVAAAANAGHWAELAGGGQVTPEILAENLAKLQNLLRPGVSAQFNSMFLDPYLWNMHVGGKRLVPKARANGAPIDGIVVSAGMPDLEDAAALVKELRAGGFPWVAFKPGAVKHIRKVLQLARMIPEIPVIMQVEGGKAGGHHSWEELDDLLIATYAEIRAHENVVLAVGGGIGTPERAADYLTGVWARAYQLPDMPVDAILVGTAAMATKEAKTSQAVKQLLVETAGTNDWVPAGGTAAGMASGRSQLGADIHEVENSFSRAGRLLDEVAGDAEAVASRREEIIEAIGRTAKPYFGDVDAMTYREWLNRYLELSGPTTDGEAAETWVDATWQRRYAEMVQRTEARLCEQDHGEFEPTAKSISDLERFNLDQTLHPADAHWFLQLCRTPGKPVNFVPVIDQDVRRWWRSDSLWQSQDDRYSADQVCIIPGIEAVAGITKIDEPVADLLARFNAETINRLGGSENAQLEKSRDIVQRIIDAPSTYWAGRHIPSLVGKIGAPEEWKNGEHPSGAKVTPLDAEHALLHVPLHGNDGSNLRVRFTLTDHIAAPTVTPADAEEAMAALTLLAAGGEFGELRDGKVHWETSLNPADVADYNSVTQGYLPVGVAAPATAPDVLVGKAWPAIFAALRHAQDGAIVEGMLSLVHLEHHITLLRDFTPDALEGEHHLEVTAGVDEVLDTTIGRIVVIRAELVLDGEPLAKLSERMAIRGRNGDAVARTNTSALPSVVDTPHSHRRHEVLRAPDSMHAFALVSGDHNPIHTSEVAAKLAGLSDGVIVHGMWTSAMAELMVGGRIKEYTATMLAPVLPGQVIEFDVQRTGIDTRPGRGEVREVIATVDGEVVLTATAVLAEPETFYAFPGQGIQHPGMGMVARGRSKAANKVWQRADHHTRTKLGFSVLEIVEHNPTTVNVGGEEFSHPEGVLFLTQFTQVAMATLAVAQVAEMREAHALQEHAYFAGHSVGEYTALAAYAGVLSLENVLEIVYRRGLTMHRLVERDAEGNSNYGLAALRPHKMGLSEQEVFGFVTDLAQRSGEFLEIVNYNLAGKQYAVAGTAAGLKVLEEAAEKAAPGQRAYIKIPGIDVPFHSSHLLGGVDDFREHLDSLLPEEVDTSVLVGRYIPNLVARPFELSEDFAQAMLDVVDSEIVREIKTNFASHLDNPGRLARTLLVELLAWQFASPVRWIETQELLMDSTVERFVEVGVAQSPTLSNMMAQTLATRPDRELEILNVERDHATVFATDEVQRPELIQDAEPQTPAAEESAQPDNVSAEPAIAQPVAASPAGPRPDDLTFTPEDATAMLIALWTKVRPDQMAATDSIESLVDGVSSKRNQLLLDLGVEFGLGAIDGAAEAELQDLYQTVAKLAKGYAAFGPVLSDAANDALRRITGPAGKRPGYVAERVTQTWQLGQGWADHVVAAVVTGTREGASLRGGDLATLSIPANAKDLDAVIDQAVQEVAAAHGVSVALPTAAGGASAVVDSAALGEFAEQVTGEAGVLATTARTILNSLGLDTPVHQDLGEESDQSLIDLVTAELGADWPRQVAPVFDANKAVLLDDRWASAREDVARVAAGELSADAVDVTGSGEAVAQQAEFLGLEELAEQARSTADAFAKDVAVVTGASPNSIASAVVGELLAGGSTVVVTTSSTGRLDYYKQLYRDHARGEAALWVVPANLRSFTDVDALATWIGSEQTATVNGATKVLKRALVPTLAFPFAAPRVSGSLADAGPEQEAQMRLLLWSVERLIAKLSLLGTNTHVGQRLHVVLPGSPNRGRFGGDGAYGEAKAALDALVTRWHAESAWKPHTSLVHVLIGWVRGTGLMGGNDPLVEAVENAGVRTFSTEEMAQVLVEQLHEEVREKAALEPVVVDATGGLGEADLDLAELARSQRGTRSDIRSGASLSEDIAEPKTVMALPNLGEPKPAPAPDFAGQVTQPLDEMVVIVGAGELGPYGSARTRYEAELSGDLTAAGVLELAWQMGLVHWDNGWFDANEQEVAEEEIFERFHDEVLARVGVRRYHDDFGMVGNLAPELTTVYLDEDLSFNVADKETAKSFVDSDPEHTTARPASDTGEWVVTRKAGSAVRVPRRTTMTRFVGGQIPEGFDPSVYGIPADMVDNLDRVAVWNLVCTVEAFLSAGFSPAELLAHLHPSRVSSTQGTGLGGMEAMRSLYIDGLLAEPRQHDILQEALPNVMAAHVMQSYVGGYGQMVHPVAACATAAVSVEEAVDKIKLGKADVVVAGGFDDLSIEGITGFGDMAATADSFELEAKGIEHRYFSRANDRRRAGFVESAGGGTLLLARGSVAAELGLPVLAVVGFAESFADGAHQSIPAPGLGALGAARGGTHSRLSNALADLGVSADDIAVVSKHDTSTTANDPNESDLHERIAEAIGRSQGNPLYVISQKSLTGHAKGGAAAFQMIGLTQVLRDGVIPPNFSLDCVDPVLKPHEHLVWLRRALKLPQAPKAGLVTSLGFGHVSALVALVHPAAFEEALRDAQQAPASLEEWNERAERRKAEGSRAILETMYGQRTAYQRPKERNLGRAGDKELEAKVLLSDNARLRDGVYRVDGQPDV